MPSIIHPILLYLGLAVGGVGVLMALPRPRVSPQVVGALVAAAGFGAIFLGLALSAGESRPNVFFYLFSLIALGSGLRVITHPRPVYAALYFIMTILASSALYLLLGAEFMAFALIIIYAGAILITYLFVIMLASQAPSEDDPEGLAAYDTYSREPGISTAIGFVLLALLTGMMAGGVGELRPPASAQPASAALLSQMPKKVLAELDRRGAFPAFEKPAIKDVANVLDVPGRTITLKVADAERLKREIERGELAGMLREPDLASARVGTLSAGPVTLLLPDRLRVDNIEGVGFALISEHPMALELAGVILLMAMLGAVVLARRQIEAGEEAKARAAMGAGGGA